MDVILSVKDLSFSYGSHKALESVRFEMRRGEILCVMGPNGSGKSTLIDCVMGIHRPERGTILLDGKDVLAYSRQEIAQHAAYVPQNHSVAFPYTVRETVMMGRTAYLPAFGSPRAEDEALAEEAMRRIGISPLADRSYGSISGGELRLVLLARALCQQTPLILMDEPTAHLDYRNELKLLEMISDLSKSDGISVLIATHAPNQAFFFEAAGCDVSALFLREGVVTARGRPGEIITERRLEEVYGVQAKILEHEGEKTILLRKPL